MLEKNGILNVSETDTECIVNLLAFHYEQQVKVETENDKNERIKWVQNAIRKTIDMLEGPGDLRLCVKRP